MTLYFLQNNVHFNFKSENDFMNIESKCVKMTIKNSSNYKHYDFSFRFEVNVCLGLFVCFYLLNVVLLGLILLFEKPSAKENITHHVSRGIRDSPKSDSKWLLAYQLLQLKKKYSHQQFQPLI
jgi:hypothetical protein